MLFIVPFNCDPIAFSFPLNFVEHLDPINVKLAELREALESVTAEQKYLKARDARHRHSMMLLSCLVKLFSSGHISYFWCRLPKKKKKDMSDTPSGEVLELVFFVHRSLCLAVR